MFRYLIQVEFDKHAELIYLLDKEKKEFFKKMLIRNFFN
jgi:hypothetical protein